MWASSPTFYKALSVILSEGTLSAEVEGSAHLFFLHRQWLCANFYVTDSSASLCYAQNDKNKFGLKSKV